MATLSSRFQRRAAADERVGEILSDSNSEIASLDDGDDDDEEDNENAGNENARRVKSSVSVARRRGPEAASASEDDAEEEDKDGNEDNKSTLQVEAARVHQRPAPLQAIKRKNSKWYDSDDDDDDWDHVASDGERVARHPTKAAASTATATPVTQPPNVTSPDNNTKSSKTKTLLSPEATATGATGGKPTAAETGGRRSSFQRLVGKTFNLSPFGSKRKGLDVASPQSSGPDTPRGGSAPTHTKTKSSNPITRMRSPLSDVTSSVGEDASSSPADRGRERRPPATGATQQQHQSRRRTTHDPSGVLSDQTADVASPQSYRNSPAAGDPSSSSSSSFATVATGAGAGASASANSRRRSNMVQSPGATGNDEQAAVAARRGSELPMAAAALGPSLGDSALSPGQRRMPGAFPGQPDSGVLLEGWLKQKQRRGVKGMKRWNARYFVLYASKSKGNEVRYYADVVPSAWGPLPLGEIGCISLRLIQRIRKPSAPKYKGCRLDITCRNTWGTHYADDYVSSEDENNNSNSTNNNNNDKTQAADKNSTPKSSRVYSLMADSPQAAGAWFSTLDSLLVRSAISPRVDVAPPPSGSTGSGSSSSTRQLQRLGSANTTSGTTRRRSSALDVENIVLCGAQDHVPKPVRHAIDYIDNSTPGIETETFYEQEPDPVKLKSALKFLNQFATSETKPRKSELELALDPITAGAVVKLWLTQLPQPIVPYDMYDDFCAVAADAKAAPFELPRQLTTLVRALPERNLAMLARLLFHLNDVNVYASKNGMDAGVLAAMFAEFIVRPRPPSGATNQDDAASVAARVETEKLLLRGIVEEMIAHVDAIIDEKEAES